MPKELFKTDSDGEVIANGDVFAPLASGNPLPTQVGHKVDDAFAFVAKTTTDVARTSDGCGVDEAFGGDGERNDDGTADCTFTTNGGVAQIAVNEMEELLLGLLAVIAFRIVGFDEEQGHDFRDAVCPGFSSVLGFGESGEAANLGGGKTADEEEEE